MGVYEERGRLKQYTYIPTFYNSSGWDKGTKWTQQMSTKAGNTLCD